MFTASPRTPLSNLLEMHRHLMVLLTAFQIGLVSWFEFVRQFLIGKRVTDYKRLWNTTRSGRNTRELKFAEQIVILSALLRKPE